MSTPGKEAVSAAKAAGLTDREKEILFKSWKCLKSFPEVDYDKLCVECDLSTKKNASNQWLKIKKKLFPDGVPVSMATTIGNASSPGTPGRKRKNTAGAAAPAPPMLQATADKEMEKHAEVTVPGIPVGGAAAGGDRSASAPAGNSTAPPAPVGSGRAASVPAGSGTAAFTSAVFTPIANPFHVPTGSGGSFPVPAGNGTAVSVPAGSGSAVFAPAGGAGMVPYPAGFAPKANPFLVPAGSGGPFYPPTGFAPTSFKPAGSGGSASALPTPTAADRAAAANIMAAVSRIPGLGKQPIEAYLPSSAPVSPAKMTAPLAQDNTMVVGDVPPTPTRVGNTVNVDGDGADMGSAAKRRRSDQAVPDTPKVAVSGVPVSPDTLGASGAPGTPKTPKSQKVPKIPKTPRAPKTPKRSKTPRSSSKKTPKPAEVAQDSPRTPDNKVEDTVTPESVFALIKELAAKVPQETAAVGATTAGSAGAVDNTPTIVGAVVPTAAFVGTPTAANIAEEQKDTVMVDHPVVDADIPAAASVDNKAVDGTV